MSKFIDMTIIDNISFTNEVCQTLLIPKQRQSANFKFWLL